MPSTNDANVLEMGASAPCHEENASNLEFDSVVEVITCKKQDQAHEHGQDRESEGVHNIQPFFMIFGDRSWKN